MRHEFKKSLCMQSKTPPLIAIIGSDGSGKSTVCEHLIHYINKYGPAVRVHLGKQAGNVERSVIKLPLLGHILDNAIKRNKVVAAKSSPARYPAWLLCVLSSVVCGVSDICWPAVSGG